MTCAQDTLSQCRVRHWNVCCETRENVTCESVLFTLVLSAPLVLQVYSRLKYPHASLRCPCVHFSRDVRWTFCLGSESSKKSKSESNGWTIGYHHCGLLVWRRIAITSTDRHQLGTCHLLNFFDTTGNALWVFMQEIPFFIVLQIVHTMWEGRTAVNDLTTN